MKILITGARGQLGCDLEHNFFKIEGCQVVSFGREEMDVTQSTNVQELVAANTPDVVIHSAANTNVDSCELEPDSAYCVNALGSRNIAVASEMVGAKLVYVSTDYVFDGTSQRPYTEFDKTNPISIYGKSKLAGERYVAGFSSKYFIVRTSWLYGEHGNNFVKTMLRLAKEKTELNVVDDQVGSPTYTKDLARFIAVLLRTDLYGIYHATNTGSCSWFQFAETIFQISGLSHIKVNPITTSELNRPAPRPAYSILDHYCIRLEGLPDLRPWEEALHEYLSNQR
ncbi:dTDP-4-dehydrorhamnose reductase [Desulfotruncus arcticus]|uniref:dTDP-4-dehydrorhamnose reductase n=1 Tax=Desulfotruncus arcticus TaxID=341036 RepID=UPI000B880C33|nr:dTDP-4-dehydrorhamnose reductase [Desulfotruncus arcticus]